jgi:hypothetical protein
MEGASVERSGRFFAGAVGRLTQNREFREFSEFREFRGYTADIHSRTILLSKGVVPDYTTLILCTILASECAVTRLVEIRGEGLYSLYYPLTRMR